MARSVQHQRVALHHFSAYYPQTDGKNKAVNNFLDGFQRCMCGDRPKEWIHFLSLVKRLFNTNFHSSTYLTPYEVVYGQHPTLFIPYFPQGYMTEVVDIILQRMEETIRLFKHHTSILIWRMKKKSEKRDLKGCFRLVIWFT